MEGHADLLEQLRAPGRDGGLAKRRAEPEDLAWWLTSAICTFSATVIEPKVAAT
jgi:hypothetical protein